MKNYWTFASILNWLESWSIADKSPAQIDIEPGVDKDWKSVCVSVFDECI